jgi:hypothetical protein
VPEDLFRPRLGEPHHYAYVVEDIEATVDRLVDQLGAGPSLARAVEGPCGGPPYAPSARPGVEPSSHVGRGLRRPTRSRRDGAWRPSGGSPRGPGRPGRWRVRASSGAGPRAREARSGRRPARRTASPRPRGADVGVRPLRDPPDSCDALRRLLSEPPARSPRLAERLGLLLVVQLGEVEGADERHPRRP